MNQALCALLFLYGAVMERPLNELKIVRAKRPKRLPVVMSRDQVKRVLAELEGEHRLVALPSTVRGCGSWSACGCG